MNILKLNNYIRATREQLKTAEYFLKEMEDHQRKMNCAKCECECEMEPLSFFKFEAQEATGDSYWWTANNLKLYLCEHCAHNMICILKENGYKFEQKEINGADHIKDNYDALPPTDSKFDPDLLDASFGFKQYNQVDPLRDYKFLINQEESIKQSTTWKE